MTAAEIFDRIVGHTRSLSTFVRREGTAFDAWLARRLARHIRRHAQRQRRGYAFDRAGRPL